MLADKPPPLDTGRDAHLGGIAEYLFKRRTPESPPSWIGDRDRYMAMPWFPGAESNPGLIEYLTFANPAEFRNRNVMVDDQPLRRANMPRR